MIPCLFPQQNAVFKSPSDLDDSQVFSIPAFKGTKSGGNLDGVEFVVVAWKPTPDEMKDLLAGRAIYLSMLGGLAPHFLSTSFDQACNF